MRGNKRRHHEKATVEGFALLEMMTEATEMEQEATPHLIGCIGKLFVLAGCLRPGL